MTSDKNHFLRVIVDNTTSRDSDKPRRLRRKTHRQLDLPLNISNQLLVINMLESTMIEVRTIISKVSPKWIFDIRTFPRLDIVAGSRLDAFRLFTDIGASYIDVLGLTGVMKYRSAEANPYFWFPILREAMVRKDELNGPFIALMDDIPLINSSLEYLPPNLSSVVNHPISALAIP